MKHPPGQEPLTPGEQADLRRRLTMGELVPPALYGRLLATLEALHEADRLLEQIETACRKRRDELLKERQP